MGPNISFSQIRSRANSLLDGLSVRGRSPASSSRSTSVAPQLEQIELTPDIIQVPPAYVESAQIAAQRESAISSPRDKTRDKTILSNDLDEAKQAFYNEYQDALHRVASQTLYRSEQFHQEVQMVIQEWYQSTNQIPAIHEHVSPETIDRLEDLTAQLRLLKSFI